MSDITVYGIPGSPFLRSVEIALKETRGNRRRAAEMLGIGERTLYRKIKEYRVPEQVFT